MSAQSTSPDVLAARIDALARTTERMSGQYGRMDEKLDNLLVRMAVVEQHNARLAAVEATAKDYEKMKQRGIGVWLLLLLFGSAFGGLILRKLGLGA